MASTMPRCQFLRNKGFWAILSIMVRFKSRAGVRWGRADLGIRLSDCFGECR